MAKIWQVRRTSILRGATGHTLAGIFKVRKCGASTEIPDVSTAILLTLMF